MTFKDTKFMAIDAERNEKFADGIPWEWEETVCSCIEGVTPTIQQIGSGMSNKFCLACKKRLRWGFIKCTLCKNIYDYMFRHHAAMSGGWADKKAVCWTCIVASDPAEENDIPPDYIGVPRQPRSLSELVAMFEDDDDLTF